MNNINFNTNYEPFHKRSKRNPFSIIFAILFIIVFLGVFIIGYQSTDTNFDTSQNLLLLLPILIVILFIISCIWNTKQAKLKTMRDYVQDNEIQLKVPNIVKESMIDYKNTMRQHTSILNDKKYLVIGVIMLVTLSMFIQISIFLPLAFFIFFTIYSLTHIANKLESVENLKNIFIDKIVYPIMKENYDNVIVDANKNTSPRQFINRSILPNSRDYNQDLMIKTNDFMILNYWMYNRHNHDNDERQTTYETLFRGQVIITKSPIYIDGSIRIFSKHKSSYKKASVKDLYKYESDNNTFNKTFNVYMESSELSTFMTQTIINRLLELQADVPIISICLEHDKLYISIYSNEYLFDVPLSTKEVNNYDLNADLKMFENLIYYRDSIIDIFKY